MTEQDFPMQLFGAEAEVTEPVQNFIVSNKHEELIDFVWK